MPKLIKFKRRHAKKNPGESKPKRNPPLGTDIVEYIVPGFAAFAGTRFLTRVASTQIAKRWPKYAKHAGALASVGAGVAAWFGAHRIKFLEPYHHAIVVGSAIATAQSLIQLYVPMLGWIVSDASPELGAAAVAGGGTASSLVSAAPPELPPVPAGFRETSASEWYTYNDAFDAGAYGNKGNPTSQATGQAQQNADQMMQEQGQEISDLLDNSDLGLS